MEIYLTVSILSQFRGEIITLHFFLTLLLLYVFCIMRPRDLRITRMQLAAARLLGKDIVK